MESRNWQFEAPNKVDWHELFVNKQLMTRFILSFILLIVLLIAYGKVLLFIEQRDTYILVDPILSQFNPIDFTWHIFAIMYGSMILAFITIISKPYNLLIAIQVYSLVSILRMISMYLLPIDAPQNIIPLVDPIVSYFGAIEINTKDLFFSGHTSTMLCFVFVTHNRWHKRLFILLAIMVAMLLILQHVHYVVDIFAALFFTYGAYSFVKWANLEFLGDKSFIFDSKPGE